MPIPLLAAIPAASAGAAAAYAGLTSEAVQGRVRRIVQRLGPDFVQNAVDNLGIELDVTQGFNDETITAAINKTFLSGAGFQLASVFDGAKLKRGLLEEGLKALLEKLDLGGATTIYGVTIKLQDFITAEAIAQLAASAGEIYDAAAESKRVRAILDKQNAEQEAEGGKRDYSKPTDFTPAGIANRERQARYRANHRRIWVARGE